MEYVKSFKDLEVYKLSRQLSKEIFEISRKFPREEMYSLTDQVRRSSRSIGAGLKPPWIVSMSPMKSQMICYAKMPLLEKC